VAPHADASHRRGAGVRRARVEHRCRGQILAGGDTAFWIEPDAILVSGDVIMSTLPQIGAASKLSTWLQSLDRFEDELQDKYDRNRMAGAIRAAYNEAP
jgi:hypothetical protein